jgi:2-hydroxychromene-2-carboxylate isomerase
MVRLDFWCELASPYTYLAATERAVALHIFGAPTFLVGDEMRWGNDRLERALAWASAAR